MGFHDVLSQFNLKDVQKIENLSGGIVNLTYKITTPKGKFIVQRLSKIFDERLIEDYLKLQEFLHENKFNVPKLVQNKDKGHFLIDDGRIWRIFENIEHDNVSSINEDAAFEAGKALGKFHQALSSFDHQPKFNIKDFHDARKIIKRLNLIAEEDMNAIKYNEIKTHHEFIINNIKKHYLPEDLPKTIIHGDPKFENFLFKGNKVAAMIDFDTVMLANELIDIGDALGSWCCKDGSQFDENVFNTAVEGYMKGNNVNYSIDEMKNAMALITLELAARFLIDYFEESYFEWDKENYSNAAEHNKERCKDLIEYYMNFMHEN